LSKPSGVRRDIAQAATRWTPDELSGGDFTVFGSDPSPSNAAASSADELRARLEEAYAGGYAEGMAAAVAQERARLATALRTLEDALANVREHEQRWVANAEENLCALAVAVARHVVEREIGASPALVRNLVARALADFPLDQTPTVRVHPTDLPLLLAGAAESGARGFRADANWVADARIGRGGCVIEGRDRIIDGRVDTALERLYRSLSATNA
jgi:flagellar assembly protein FliH